MSSLYQPSPCLLGILLSVSTHDGNHLVFHYPPNPRYYGYRPVIRQPTSNSDESSSSENDTDDSQNDVDEDEEEDEEEEEEEEEEDDDDGRNYYDDRKYGGSHRRFSSNERQSNNQTTPSERASMRSAINSMRTNISSLQQTSNQGSIVGSPNTGPTDPSITEESQKLFGFEPTFLSEIVSPSKPLCNSRFELSVDDMAFLGLPIHIGDDGNWRPTKHKHRKGQHKKHVRTGSADSEDSAGGGTGNDSHSEVKSDCPMYMFNLVFVMNPPVDEYNYRIDEMYHYVVSRIALLLRYEQQKSNYVWEEVQKIAKLEEEAINMSPSRRSIYILERSQLANIVRQTYEGISNSDIVNIEINGKYSSFQIPTQTEFNVIPPKNFSIQSGSTLSSISPFKAAGHQTQLRDSEWSAYFALVLLDNPESIIRDIRAEKDSVIANFIRMIKPSESLARLSVLSGLGIEELKLFASHLVYWRRAKAILPLAPRNIFIVSPIAPIELIYKDSVAFRKQFPTLPNLSNLLAHISSNSSRPRPISAIIPSRDHRDLYMDAVAWLTKRGYLTQLYTFVSLRITKEVKIKVAEELEMEKKRRQKKSTDDENAIDSEDGSSDAKEDDADTRHRDNNDNRVHRGDSPNNQSSDAVQSTGSGSSGFKPKLMVQFEEEDEQDTILTDPESATALERRWIAKSVEGKPSDVVNLFYKLLKYMNGKSPLELFILKDGVSRQDVRKLLSVLGGEIVTVRHW